MTDKIFDEHTCEHLNNAESMSELSSMKDGFEALRPLGIEDFGNVLWNMPSEHYPNLSAILPKMAADEVTIQWTGAAGFYLLQQSVGFVRSCAENYAAITGSPLKEKRILDFGCGYGRFLRLFSYYSNEVYGVDAFEGSLEHSRAAGFSEQIRKSDEVPDQIPFDKSFDFLFAFSVFTHLSERATIASLKALRKVAHDGAVLAITIRPVQFWSVAASGGTHLDKSKLNAKDIIEEHQKSGFAFYVQDQPNHKKAGCNYGETSMTIEWLLGQVPGWDFKGTDRSLNDPQQRYIFLQAI